MNQSQAKRAMLRPRKTRCYCGWTPGWYYVEDDGISVFNENCKGAFSFLTWHQIDLALALKRTALNRGGVK
jgi:hypothetical protein